MKIAIATPLYPPDVAEPGPYCKELARRLAATHTVTVLTYGAIPEKVPGVCVTVVSKQLPIPLRLFTFTRKLWEIARTHDVLIIENGPSVEVPGFVVRALYNVPLLIHLGDPRAQKRTSHSAALSYIQKKLVMSGFLMPDSPSPRPEIFPLELYPTSAVASYEKSWDYHMLTLNTHLHGI